MGKKKDKKDKKKKKEAKKKKDKKKKKKEAKKTKKQGSTSSSGSSDESTSAGEKPEAKKRKKEDAAEAPPEAVVREILEAPLHSLDLPPPEEGIKRFEFEADEKGPLGLRFSGGFPPLILAVLPDSFASKKGMPVNFEVHAINGYALLPQNNEVVMSGLKSRPVTLDVRPQGWKPKEKVRELERRREREEAERQAMVELEEKRREQVAKEAEERAEREAAERAVREEQERLERDELERRAREAKAVRRAKEEDFEKSLARDPPELRKAATELMEAEYGSAVRLEGTGRSRGLPLRLLTRRKEVAWLWAGEVQELIGGGAREEAADTWS